MAGEARAREMPRTTRPPDASTASSTQVAANGRYTSHKTAPPTRRLGKKRDVAARLNCSEDSVDRFERAGKLPIVVRLPSGRKRYDLDALDRLIEDWKVPWV
jgi:hypothetical protein